MNFFVLREEFFRQLVCLMDKEGCAYQRIGSDCNLWQCGEREKKTPKNIIHTPIDKQIHLNQNYGISRWVGYQSDCWGTFYITVSFICHFPSTGSGQVFLCEKGFYRAMNCYSRTKPERFKYQQNEFFFGQNPISF